MTNANEWTFYVLRHLNGRFVDQDMSSGGYPRLVDDFRKAHTFDSFEEAFRYKGVFSKNEFDSDKWRILRCEVTASLVSVETFLKAPADPVGAETQKRDALIKILVSDLARAADLAPTQPLLGATSLGETSPGWELLKEILSQEEKND